MERQPDIRIRQLNGQQETHTNFITVVAAVGYPTTTQQAGGAPEARHRTKIVTLEGIKLGHETFPEGGHAQSDIRLGTGTTKCCSWNLVKIY